MDSRQRPLASCQNIGIIGTGQMGRGITLSCLLSGYSVNLYDKEQAALSKSLEKIKTSLEKFFSQGKISEIHSFLWCP